jgi:sporulation protein YabP
MEEKISKKHALHLMDRQHLTMSGVVDVYAFDEQMIELETVEGYLSIEGADLHIVRMNLDNGELIVEGTVWQLIYQEPEDRKKKGSLLSKFFR